MGQDWKGMPFPERCPKCNADIRSAGGWRVVADHRPDEATCPSCGSTFDNISWRLLVRGPSIVGPGEPATEPLGPGGNITILGTSAAGRIDFGSPPLHSPAAPGDEFEDLITLDQIAALVSRKKRALENYKSRMPLPRVKGGGGRPSEWAYSDIRPWLEKQFERPLPPRFPFGRFPRRTN